MSISIFDCTLRDGGYVNNFAFGYERAKGIIAGLIDSDIDYIEVGFLRNSRKTEETTVFTSADELAQLLPTKPYGNKIFAMIVYGTYVIDKLPPKKYTSLDGIRVTFKKKEIDEALEYIRKVKEKGYMVSANPTGVNSYTDKEILEMLDKVNVIEPDFFAIVDTLGVLKRYDVLRLTHLVHHNLKKNISLAFHSHNNLQLSFSNAEVFIENIQHRHLVIDTSVMGMGRGAGNLCTELLLQFLNDNYDTHYKLLPILKVSDEQISRIFASSPWGYNVPYYLAAVCSCHPNYASYLMDKQSLSVNAIHSLLTSIPEMKRATYDENIISELYTQYQNNKVDDSKVIEVLSGRIGSSKVLILGSGKSIVSYSNKIRKRIETEKPFLISLNFTPADYPVDLTFISNAKRFAEHKGGGDLVITSNISATGIPTLNYGSYINNSGMPDNSLLMLLKVLVSIGVSRVMVAGCDGFGKQKDNYFSDAMINNAKLGEFDLRNKIMSEELRKLGRVLSLEFITPSLYEI